MKQPRWELISSEWQTASDGFAIDRIPIDRDRRVELIHIGPVIAFDGNSPVLALKAVISSEDTDVALSERIPETIWGHYVAVIIDEQKSSRIFVPDPMKSVQLFYRQGYGGRISLDVDLERLVAGRQPVWSIGFLVNFAETGYGVEGHTPFSDVGSVPAGHCLQVNGDGKIETRRVWFGPSASRAGNVDLADEVTSTLRALFEEHANICLPVSGEIASSVAAIWLEAALPSSEAIRFIEVSPSGPMAVANTKLSPPVAKMARSTVAKVAATDAAPLATLVPKRLPTSLNERLLYLKREEAVLDIAGEHGILVDWHGGDVLLNAVPDEGTVLDAFRAKGTSFALATAKKLAGVRRTSLSKILADSIYRALVSQSDPRNHKKGGYRGLFPDRSDIIPKSRIRRPRIVQRRLSSTPTHWANLARAQNLQAPPFSASVPILNPYFSQPVVEAAMRRKSYHSFLSEPDQLDLRNFPRNTDFLFEQSEEKNMALFLSLRQNHEDLMEFIKNGVLMKSGYLDRSKLAKAFNLILEDHVPAARSLSLIACVEIFCSAWESAVEPETVKPAKSGAALTI
ncbi:hypothetical protein V6R98_26405 [Agrobacterium sp. CCNWLW71]|uniref:hypothetical protein n=1 Tax=unclassified Agrobacterium TaxID=2632611 RepID=UPI002FF3C88F